MSVRSVAACLEAATFVKYAQSVGWEVDEAAALSLTDNKLGKFVHNACAAAPVNIRDRVHEDFERVGKLAREKSGTAIRDAVGPPGELSAALENLGSDESRALYLLFRHPEVFERAAHAVEYSSKIGAQQKKWLGYRLRDFSDDWSPEEIDVELVKQKLEETVSRREKDRLVRIDVFERPDTPAGWDGPRYWQFSVSISQRETRREQWVKGELQTVPAIENRRLQIAVTPWAATLQAVRNELDVELFLELVQTFAEAALGQTGPLDPFQHRAYSLDHLRARPVFRTHDEHGIGPVKVTKLVVASGVGVTVHQAPARSVMDAYDVAAADTGRPVDRAIAGRIVLAAELRVEFKPRGTRKGRIVTFEVTRSNKCSLRESSEYERLIIETYLVDWGFLAPPDAGPIKQNAA